MRAQMEWVVFLLLTVSLGAGLLRQYQRAAAGPRLSAQSVAVMGALVAGFTIASLTMVTALRSRVGESVDDAIGLLF